MDSLEKTKKELMKIKNKHSIAKRVLKSNIPMSFRVCIEISSAIIAGLIIGAILDKLFETKIIFTILCLILGCISSFRTIYILMMKK